MESIRTFSSGGSLNIEVGDEVFTKVQKNLNLKKNQPKGVFLLYY